MGYSVVDLGVILAKLQTTFGTMATPLISTDYIQPTSISIELDAPASKIESVGANFGQDPSVIGPRGATVKAPFSLRTGVSKANPGDWARFLKCCGFKETILSSLYTYTLGKQSDWKDMTINGYSGNQISSRSLMTVISNLLFSAKIALDFDKAYGTIEFNGKGVYSGLPIITTQPTVTRQSVVTPNLIGYTGNFIDASYTLLSLNFDLSNEISVCIDPQASDGSGKGISLLTDMKIKWDAKVYIDSGMLLPFIPIVEGNQYNASIAWGNSNTGVFTLSDSALLIETVKESDQNKVKTYDLTGISVGNGLSLSVNLA